MLQRHLDQALDELNHSLELRCTAATLSSLGSVYFKARNFETAAAYFLRASRTNAFMYFYHVNAGLALRELPEKLSEATNQFKLALLQTPASIKRSGERTLARAYQGLCEAALGRAQEAREDLNTAREEAGLDLNVLRIVYHGFQILHDNERAREVEKLMEQRAGGVSVPQP